MTCTELISAINTAQEAIIVSGHMLPMTDARIMAAQQAIAIIQQGVKLREVPRHSVVYLLRDKEMIEITYDATNRVYWASTYDEYTG